MPLNPAAILLTLACLTPNPASALLLTVSWEGTISSRPPELWYVFAIGQAAHGSFQIESTTPDHEQSSERAFYAGPVNWSYTFGSYTATSTGSVQPFSGTFIEIHNDGFLNNPGDKYSAIAQTEVFSPALPQGFPISLSLILHDPSGAAFSSQALPTSLDLADFSNGSAFARMFFQPAGLVEARLTSLSVVPEPAALALFGVAALALRRGRSGREGNRPSVVRWGTRAAVEPRSVDAPHLGNARARERVSESRGVS